MGKQIILGTMFRALGAYPSGWRQPGAHNDPRTDAAVLRRAARRAEAAALDFVYFGDWLSTGLELEHRDPYLLARVDPLSAVNYLAGLTRRIGLVATVNTGYADPYSTARSSASADLLSGGRVGLALSSTAEPRAEANFPEPAAPVADRRFDRAGEFAEALRLLWDSWEDDAFVRDRLGGRLIDATRLHAAGYTGEFIRVAGPLNAPRPVQGHPPILHAGSSAGSLRFSGRHADLALVAVGTAGEGVAVREELREHARSAGRDPDGVALVAPVMPIVAERVEEAWAVFDDLVRLLPVDDGTRADAPAGRSLRALGQVLEVPLGAVGLDAPVGSRVAARFGEYGQQLLALVTARSGRELGDGERPITYRHVLATHAVPAPVIVGDAESVADHLESWVDAGAVDGFVIQAPYLPAPFEAFTGLVVPELVRRGRFRAAYEGETLRDHLDLSRPENSHLVSRPPSRQFSGFDEVVHA